MDKLLRITLLHDFYGELLTEKQRLFYEMYFMNDLSLSEIGAQFEISPQGVWDLIKRTLKILETYESKLRLLDKFENQKEIKKNIEVLIKKIDVSANKNLKQDLEQLISAVENLFAELTL